jgi:uncharacterized membrane protein YeaQ/YmgE (transglycosylase-associated protein family)
VVASSGVVAPAVPTYFTPIKSRGVTHGVLAPSNSLLSEVVMHTTVIGLFCGLLLGLAWTTGGFEGLVVTAALGIIGFVVGKVIAGDVDLDQYLGGSRRSSR